MKALDKPHIHAKDDLIQLNGFRNSFKSQKHDQLKSQIDVILQKDYLNWKVSANKFNALNSLTAKSSDIIHTYVKGIYSDYQIQDPLQQRNGRPRDLSFTSQSLNKNSVIQESKFIRDSRFSLGKGSCQPDAIQDIYKTPTKSVKKGLEVTNSRASKQKSPVITQKYSPFKMQSKEQNQLTPQKVKFVQRTAHSPESSFALTNSKNYGWNPSQMGLSGVKNYPTRDSLLFNSKISLSNKQPQNLYTTYFLQNQKPSQQNLPSAAQFKSTRQFLNRRKQKDLSSNMQKELQMIGSEISLGENNPQREYKRKENLKYGSEFINVRQERTLFEPYQSVRESFRYCVGCEKSILEANIRIHEDKCEAFRKIFQINNIQEIICELNGKIERIVNNIIEVKSKINEKDHEKIVKSAQNLTQEIMKKIKEQPASEILNSKEIVKDYDNVISIGTNWGNFTEQINKIKWFLLIKRNFESLKIPNQEGLNGSKLSN